MERGAASRLAGPVTPTEKGEALSGREREVLQLIAEGLPNKQIALRLGISPHTAKFHVAGVLQKLGAASRTEAVSTGLRRGWVSL
jgi:DNA-binding NarL/FixJ family response regulator